MTLYDISPLLGDNYPVWPGDVPLSREFAYNMDKGDSSTVSALRATAHLGAHADAPAHYGKGAYTIDERSLDYYLGPCQVIEVTSTQGVSKKDVEGKIKEKRILIKTNSCNFETSFPEEFAYFTEDFMEYCHLQGVKTVGIDTPSIDPYKECSLLKSHKKALEYDMAILECLKLDQVPAGIYELIALPLKLQGFDASPVRAVLRIIE